MTENERELFDERIAIVAESADDDTALLLARQAVENYRHQCEVKTLAREQQQFGNEHVRRYLTQVAEKRGQALADRLRKDTWELLKEWK